MTDFENYEKIHDYLLTHAQQELAGHLDNLWQEVTQYRPTPAALQPLEEGSIPDPQFLASLDSKPRGDGLDSK